MDRSADKSVVKGHNSDMEPKIVASKNASNDANNNAQRKDDDSSDYSSDSSTNYSGTQYSSSSSDDSDEEESNKTVTVPNESIKSDLKDTNQTLISVEKGNRKNDSESSSSDESEPESPNKTSKAEMSESSDDDSIDPEQSQTSSSSDDSDSEIYRNNSLKAGTVSNESEDEPETDTTEQTHGNTTNPSAAVTKKEESKSESDDSSDTETTLSSVPSKHGTSTSSDNSDSTDDEEGGTHKKPVSNESSILGPRIGVVMNQRIVVPVHNTRDVGTQITVQQMTVETQIDIQKPNLINFSMQTMKPVFQTVGSQTQEDYKRPCIEKGIQTDFTESYDQTEIETPIVDSSSEMEEKETFLQLLNAEDEDDNDLLYNTSESDILYKTEVDLKMEQQNETKQKETRIKSAPANTRKSIHNQLLKSPYQILTTQYRKRKSRPLYKDKKKKDKNSTVSPTRGSKSSPRPKTSQTSRKSKIDRRSGQPVSLAQYRVLISEWHNA